LEVEPSRVVRKVLLAVTVELRCQDCGTSWTEELDAEGYDAEFFFEYEGYRCPSCHSKRIDQVEIKKVLVDEIPETCPVCGRPLQAEVRECPCCGVVIEVAERDYAVVLEFICTGTSIEDVEKRVYDALRRFEDALRNAGVRHVIHRWTDVLDYAPDTARAWF